MKGKISIHGYTFKNENEYRRYMGILGLVKEGRLSELDVNPKYDLIVNEQLIDSYCPTFIFKDVAKNQYRYIQVNGVSNNPALEMKIRLFSVLYEVEVERW